MLLSSTNNCNIGVETPIGVSTGLNPVEIPIANLS